MAWLQSHFLGKAAPAALWSPALRFLFGAWYSLTSCHMIDALPVFPLRVSRSRGGRGLLGCAHCCIPSPGTLPSTLLSQIGLSIPPGAQHLARVGTWMGSANVC